MPKSKYTLNILPNICKSGGISPNLVTLSAIIFSPVYDIIAFSDYTKFKYLLFPVKVKNSSEKYFCLFRNEDKDEVQFKTT